MRTDDDYRELKSIVASAGLLERCPRRYVGPSIGLVLMLTVTLAGIATGRGSGWVLLWAVPAALLSGQLGFLAHDAAHNQILTTSRANRVLSLLLFDLCLGGSRGWWVDKHNAHHAQPNRLGSDPDIEGGVVDVSGHQATQARGVVRFMIRHQAVTIVPLLSLSVLQIHAYSARFVSGRTARDRRVELLLLGCHCAVYIGGLTLLLGLGRGLLFATVHQLLLGVYLGGAFLTNHVGMAVLQPEERMDFLRRQVLTGRNLRAGRVTDYLFGALSCQVEHHLFPAMPRHRLREAAPIVHRFCAERGIPYHETSAWEAYRQVLAHLRAVGRSAGGGDADAEQLLAGDTRPALSRAPADPLR